MLIRLYGNLTSLKGNTTHVPDVAFYSGMLRFCDVIEPYYPERVLRQFGRVQTIPPRISAPTRTSSRANSYNSYFGEMWEHVPIPRNKLYTPILILNPNMPSYPQGNFLLYNYEDAPPPNLKIAFAQKFENHIQYQVGTIRSGTPKQLHGFHNTYIQVVDNIMTTLKARCENLVYKAHSC
ncbi:unnamed protein product [Prunus armeniaca]|uniref:Uncharacterized protein n=1 Tax=Prunus armeniaca TaxID=36596 RepID=A0A6J5V7U3_PRUAR|nr:unnamed protein product [Prunus armeniaca]